MEIQEVKKRKRKMELEIAEAVNSALIRFHAMTKFSPDYINIELVDATTIGEENKAYIVNNVSCRLEI